MENFGDILVWLGLGGVILGLVLKAVLKKSRQKPSKATAFSQLPGRSIFAGDRP